MKFALLGLALFSISAIAVPPAPKAAPPAAKKPLDPQVEAWIKAATPGKEHQKLSAFAGSWKFTGKFWPNAAAKPVESSGTWANKMIMGGRFLLEEAKGKAMGQQPFIGMGLTGFNNVKKNFETLWIESRGTGMAKGTATWDDSTKALNETGAYSDPTAPSQTKSYRSVMKIVGKNNYIYEMFTKGAGDKEFRMIERKYVRAE